MRVTYHVVPRQGLIRILRSKTLLDQVVSSGSSAFVAFGGLLVATTQEYGEFAIGFAAISVAIILVRSSLLEWALFDRTRADRLREDEVRCVSHLLGTSTAGVFLILGNLLGLISVEGAVVYLTTSVVVLALDAERYLAIGRGAPARALVLDSCWLVGTLVGTGFWLLSHHDPTLMSIVWSYTIAGGLIYLWLIAGERSARWDLVGGWRHRRKVVRQVLFGGDSVVNVAGLQAIVLLLPLLSSFDILGEYRGLLTVYQPSITLVYAVRTVLLGRGDWDGNPHKATRQLVLGQVGVTMTYGGLVLIVAALGGFVHFDPIAGSSLVLVSIVGVAETARAASQCAYDLMRARNTLSVTIMMRGCQLVLLVGGTALATAPFGLVGVFSVRAIAYALPTVITARAESYKDNGETSADVSAESPTRVA